jgi:hypothetical protein
VAGLENPTFHFLLRTSLNPSIYLAWAVAALAILTGVAMMAGLIAPAVEPTMRFAFGGVLVLYGVYRLASQSARNRSNDER